jgi:CxxC motif-containing protein (DUF1111 family)
MNAKLRARCCARAVGCSLTAIVLFMSSSAAWSLELNQADEERAALRRGQELFERNWKVEHRVDGQGDGLGPLFNDRSCVACHMQGGIGGGGPLSKNVDVLSVHKPKGSLESARRRLTSLHPGFADGTSAILHRFNGSQPSYDAMRAELLSIKLLSSGQLKFAELPNDGLRDLQVMKPYRLVKYGNTVLMLTARNTTPMFGLGLIELIPVDVLEKVAQQQTLEDPQVTGRLYGRYGWRGQIKTLGEFVRGACEVEMGLTPGPAPPAKTDLAAEFAADDTAAPAPRYDITDTECNEMTAFVASLPKPRVLKPATAEEDLRAMHGKALFAKIGCAVCHRPTLYSIDGIYSDLLLHDMGGSLSDPLASRPPDPPQIDEPAVRVTGTFGIAYYGDNGQKNSLTFNTSTVPGRRPPPPSPGEMQVFRQEWKTPPLWGMRDSAPYLHDGRAATVAEAVGWHGGEALQSAKKFANMPKADRADVVTFLMTLAAPDPADLPKRIVPAESPAGDFAGDAFGPQPQRVVEYQAGRP